MKEQFDEFFVLKTLKKTGKLFLEDYKKNTIPKNRKDLLKQLAKIESTCFDILKSNLNVKYPNIPWVEDDEFNSDTQRSPAPYDQYWLCDTMDGAIQFLQHLPGWTINLALIQQGEPYFSAIYDPLSDELFWARKGKGAYLNDEPITPSTKTDTSVMMAVFEYGHQDKKDTDFNKRIGDSIAHLIENFGVVRNFGPHGLQLAYIAAGRIDLFVQEDLDTHNWLAGILIAKEAGLEIFTTNGKSWEWGNENLLVGSHHAVKEFLKLKNL